MATAIVLTLMPSNSIQLLHAHIYGTKHISIRRFPEEYMP